MKRLLLIVNPISGTKRKDKLVPKIESRLNQAGYDVTTQYTQCKGDATRLARMAVDEHYDAVAVCGGDGTVNETARALSDTSMPMAIIPAGSGNGLARHIGLPSDPIAALKAVDDANIRQCDYCTVNGTKYFCTFGLGFDAAVTKAFSKAGHRGLSTYVKSAFHEFASYKPHQYEITINGVTECVTAYLVACCNASQYGNNAYIAPEASITDGLIDVVILKDASHLKTLFAGIDMLTGMLSHNHQVDIIRTSSLKIKQLQPGPAHIDGEPFEVPPEVEVECHPAKLHLFVDPKRKKVAPFITPINYIGRDIGIAISRVFE